jgi:hypothetical protein
MRIVYCKVLPRATRTNYVIGSGAIVLQNQILVCTQCLLGLVRKQSINVRQNYPSKLLINLISQLHRNAKTKVAHKTY